MSALVKWKYDRMNALMKLSHTCSHLQCHENQLTKNHLYGVGYQICPTWKKTVVSNGPSTIIQTLDFYPRPVTVAPK